MIHADWSFCPRSGGPLGEAVAGALPLRCGAPACGFEFWNNPIPVVALIVEMDGGIVMAHNRKWPPKMRAPISGFIDFRESPEAAARRELKEELGLEPISLEMLGAYGFPSENQVVIAYHCRASGEVLLGEELDDYQLIPVEKLRAWDFGTGLAVADFLKQRLGRNAKQGG